MDTEQTLSTFAPVSAEMPHTPKVSIGMPVYNGEPFIREALDSLLAQTFTDFELIISDNASTDGTEAICREYAAKDARIRYVRQAENCGPTANFQFVLDEAVGEYFMWAAADDKRHPDFIRMAEMVLKTESEVGLVFSAMRTVNLLSGESRPSLTGFSTTHNKFLRVLFRLAQPCPSLIYGLFRKEKLSQVSLKPYDYFDLYLSLWFELNSNIRIIPLSLYTAGTNGVRVPYSLTGKFIDRRVYLSETKRLFGENFGFFGVVICHALNALYINRSSRLHNKAIASREA
jgi:glycosyltransferase involved in cell wall biosynthesis